MYPPPGSALSLPAIEPAPIAIELCVGIEARTVRDQVLTAPIHPRVLVPAGKLHRAAVDAAGAREVEAARAWMVPKYRVLSCQAVGFALAPSPGQHECIVRFANGALAHLDIAEEGGRMRVVAFSSAPPGAPAP